MTSITLYDSQAQFSLDLLRAVSPIPEKNVFFSPVSIGIALAMIYSGAAENTKHQLNSIIFGGLEDEQIHATFENLMQKLSETKSNYQLNSANRLYVQKDYQIMPNFLNTLKKRYRSELQCVDFVENASNVTKTINDWVTKMTNNRITNLIADGVLNQLTRLVLVNAIYFKGNWVHQFDENYTGKHVFHLKENIESEVEMMHIKKRFEYAEYDDCQVLGMPYKGNELSLYAFLPKSRYGIDDFEGKITGKRILQMIKELKNRQVQVSFPKFKLELSFDLKDSLKSLGVTDMFGDSADFSQITADPLSVSAVIHKAFIEVNELGSEAAAVTAVVMVKLSIPMPSPEFIADHPFHFAISDGNSLLFLGRFTG